MNYLTDDLYIPQLQAFHDDALSIYQCRQHSNCTTCEWQNKRSSTITQACQITENKYNK